MKKPFYILLAVILVSFFIRISLIFWGWQLLPYVYCPNFNAPCFHADEYKSYYSVIYFPETLTSLNRFLGYGNTMPILISPILFPLRLILDIYLQQSHIYGSIGVLVTRLFSVIIGTATIYVTYLLADRLFNNKYIALSAATITAFCPIHIIDGTIGKPTVAMSFFVVLIILLGLQFIPKYKTASDKIEDSLSQKIIFKKYIFLGILTALLAGLKLTGVFIIVIPPLIALVRKRFIWKEQLLYFIASFLSFIIFNPIVILNFREYFNFLHDQQFEWIDRFVLSPTELLTYWKETTDSAHGFGISYLVILGILFVDKKNLFEQLIPLAYVVIYYLFWRKMPGTGEITIVAPLLAIYASVTLWWFWSRRNPIFKILVLLFITWSSFFMLRSVYYAMYTRLFDPREQASKYILNSIPFQSSIGFSEVSTNYGWLEHRWRYPLIDTANYHIEIFLNYPEYLIVNSFDTGEISRGFESNKFISRNKWDEKYNNEWYRYDPPSPAVFAFYDDFLNDRTKYKLIKKFEYPFYSYASVDPYPSIYIYHLER